MYRNFCLTKIKFSSILISLDLEKIKNSNSKNIIPIMK